MNYLRDGSGRRKEVRRFIINIIFCFAIFTGSAQKTYFDNFITDTLLRSAHIGVSVFDPVANKYLHSYQSDKYFVPASNTKIITCYAALKYLPDSLSIDVRDTWWKDMGPGWAWTDDEEIENVFPVVPYLDSGAIWVGKIDSLLRPMMYRSDNFLTEQLWRLIHKQVKFDTIDVFKEMQQKPVWVDGCGLSRYNLFTPQHFVFILNKIYNEFGINRIKTIFPTGGTGTLKNYYLADKGFIYAKTGSLTGVVTLSGYLYTKKNKLLIFSVLINNHNLTASIVRRRIENFIHHLRHNN
jgi:D-alanyl-D-alanine carboxypeptidase